MDRSDNASSSSRPTSPVSSTASSPGSSPPPSPTGSFRGRDTSPEEPTQSIRPDGSMELPAQPPEKLKKRKVSIRETLGSLFKFTSKEGRRHSAPLLESGAEPTISGPQHNRPVSADADVLIRAEAFQKVRQKNRERADRNSNLSDPDSLGSRAFYAATGVSASELSAIEKEILQDELRGYLESKINKGEPSPPLLSKELVFVIKESMPALQLTPRTSAYMKRQHGRSSYAHCVRQMSGSLAPELLKSQAAAFGGAVQGTMSQLRIPVFDKLFKGASAEEQAQAYERLQEGAKNTLDSLESLKKQLENTSDHDLVFYMLEDIETMIGLIEEQQQMLHVLRKQDFRNGRNYIDGARVLLSTAEKIFDPDKVNGKYREAATAARDAATTQLQKLDSILPDQLRPNIIGDLKQLEKSLLEAAGKCGVAKPFKEELRGARSKEGWETLESLVPVRRGAVTRLYRNKAVPLGVMMGEPGTGVPSTCQDVTDKPCNAFVCESRAPDGRLTSRYMRSAVPDPYKAKNHRQEGGQRRGELQIAAALLAEYGGDADRLEKAYGTEEQAAELHILLESFLTTDQFRARTHIHDNEVEMNARAHESFANLSNPDGSPRPVSFTDANGKLRTIYIKKPEVALISCGSNALALNRRIQIFTRSWPTADAFNHDAVNRVLGEPTPGARLGGWVGDYLADYQDRHGHPHPNWGKIHELAEEWRSVILFNEHHTAELDTFKLVNPADLMVQLLREPESLKEGAVPDSGSRLPILRFKFCKSGKDRTGAGAASGDRYSQEFDMTNRVSVAEPGLTADRRFNAQAAALTNQLYVQLKNGNMGYKNDGEAKLLGETVHKARLYKDRHLGTEN